VIAHADTKTTANPVKQDSDDYGGPAPEKKRRDCSKMKAHEEKPHVQITIGPIRLGLRAHALCRAIVR
jgi:hypothetical protein